MLVIGSGEGVSAEVTDTEVGDGLEFLKINGWPDTRI